jgi:hypothetical protein
MGIVYVYGDFCRREPNRKTKKILQKSPTLSPHPYLPRRDSEVQLAQPIIFINY